MIADSFPSAASCTSRRFVMPIRCAAWIPEMISRVSILITRLLLPSGSRIWRPILHQHASFRWRRATGGSLFEYSRRLQATQADTCRLAVVDRGGNLRERSFRRRKQRMTIAYEELSASKRNLSLDYARPVRNREVSGLLLRSLRNTRVSTRCSIAVLRRAQAEEHQHTTSAARSFLRIRLCWPESSRDRR